MQAPQHRSARGDAGTTTVERADTRPAEPSQASSTAEATETVEASETSAAAETSQELDVGREVAELVFLGGLLVVLVWLAGTLL